MRKKCNETLVLKKNTVAHLNVGEMKDLKSGINLQTGIGCRPTLVVVYC